MMMPETDVGSLLGLDITEIEVWGGINEMLYISITILIKSGEIVWQNLLYNYAESPSKPGALFLVIECMTFSWSAGESGLSSALTCCDESFGRSMLLRKGLMSNGLGSLTEVYN